MKDLLTKATTTRSIVRGSFWEYQELGDWFCIYMAKSLLDITTLVGYHSRSIGACFHSRVGWKLDAEYLGVETLHIYPRLRAQHSIMAMAFSIHQ